MSADKPRTVGDKYVIERHLAVGGMGTLYVARHKLTTQRVALKVLDRQLVRDEASLERFMREARVAARVAHPGIVRVFDAGIDESPEGVRAPFLAMELLTGETLAERLARGNVPQSDALDRLLATLDPLAAAHDLGVVHRDLKPENLFLERLELGERVKLLDFGIARDTAEADHATLAGEALGTVYYMAPEQCLDARRATPAADVWSFGVMLYQSLAGVFPSDGDTVAAVMLAACRDPHRPLAALRPDLDPRLTDLVERCLSKAPADRPADADALRRELAPLVSDPAIRACLERSVVNPESYLPSDGAAPLMQSGVTPSFPPLVFDASSPGLVLAAASLAPPRAAANPTPLPAPASGASPALPASPRRRSVLAWVSVAVALAALVAATVGLRRRPADPPPPAASARASVTPVVVLPAPVVAAPAPAPVFVAPAPVVAALPRVAPASLRDHARRTPALAAASAAPMTEPASPDEATTALLPEPPDPTPTVLPPEPPLTPTPVAPAVVAAPPPRPAPPPPATVAVAATAHPPASPPLAPPAAPNFVTF